MKKQILFGIGAFSLAVMITLNVTLVKNESNAEFSLKSLLLA